MILDQALLLTLQLELGLLFAFHIVRVFGRLVLEVLEYSLVLGAINRLGAIIGKLLMNHRVRIVG